MANDTNNIPLKSWLVIIVAVSIASLSRDFLALTYMFVGGRSTIYMIDTIRLIAFANIFFTLCLFKLTRWSFFTVSSILGLMLVLSVLTGRPHAMVIYSVALGGLLLLGWNAWYDLD